LYGLKEQLLQEQKRLQSIIAKAREVDKRNEQQGPNLNRNNLRPER